MKHMRNINQAATKLGFTLIELSIVLVIIGLIVGGILVGQDLIKAAEIRATVSQIEKYSTAVNTFRSKYNGVPGDLLNASNFGFDATRGTGMSDGDAQIESSAGTSNVYLGEVTCFWDDLTTANLIGDSLNASSSCGTTGGAGTATIGNFLPITKLGRGNYITVGSSGGINYWILSGVTSVHDTTGVYILDDLMTGSEAFQIDSKVDDGRPTQGSVIAVDGTDGAVIFTAADAGAAAAAGVCIANDGGTDVYNFLTQSGNDQGCQLRMRANF